MSAEVRIIGQGLAGSLLGWACEETGLDFEIVERATPAGASSIGAGIINPITGQRLVKSWRIDQLLPIASEVYRGLEQRFEKRLFFPYRLRRLFADVREKRIAREKWERGEFAPYGESIDEQGLWIAPAFRVDTAQVVTVLRKHWRELGRYRTAEEPLVGETPLITIRCMGAAELSEDLFRFTGISTAKGELLEIETEGLEAEVIINQKQWLLPLDGNRARVGATFVPGDLSTAITLAAERSLVEATEALLGAQTFRVTSQVSGTRVVTPDKHPVVGRHPAHAELGILNGLGSKGALLAPWLAREWVQQLQQGRAFDPAVDIARFWRRSSSEGATDPKLL